MLMKGSPDNKHEQRFRFWWGVSDSCNLLWTPQANMGGTTTTFVINTRV
jgi:hypothetical protein